MDEISGLPFPGRLDDLSEPADASIASLRPAGTTPLANAVPGPPPGDSIQNAAEGNSGGLVPIAHSELPLSAPAPAPDPLPELSELLGTQLALSRLRSDVKPPGDLAAAGPPPGGMDTTMSPTPAGVSTPGPTIPEGTDSTANTIQGILGSLVQRAEVYLNQAIDQASMVLSTADAAAGLIEQQAQGQATLIRDQAASQAQAILANAQQVWLAALSAFSQAQEAPVGGSEVTVPNLTLPPDFQPEAAINPAGVDPAPVETPPPPAGSEGWDFFFQHAQFEADTMISDGQLRADTLLSDALAACQTIREDARSQAQDIQRSAIRLCGSMDENIRSIQDMVRRDQFTADPINETMNILQEMAAKDDDRKQEIAGELRSLEGIRDLIRKPGA